MAKLIVNNNGKPLMNQNGKILAKELEVQSRFIPEVHINSLQSTDNFLTDGMVSVAPNTFYVFENITTNFELVFENANANIFAEYAGQIYVDETAITVSFPTGIRWKLSNGITQNLFHQLELSANTTYIYSVVDDFGLILGIPNVVLERPQVWLGNDNILSWDAVDNADTYKIYYALVDDSTTELPVLSNILTTTTATSVDLSQYISNPGHYAIAVKAASSKAEDSTMSSFVHFAIVHQLDTPSN